MASTRLWLSWRSGLRMEKKSRGVFAAVMRYLIFIGGVTWLFSSPLVIDFQISFRETSKIDFSFLRWPLTFLISGFFMGRIADELLSGKWVKQIQLSFRTLGAICALYYMITLPNAPESLRFGSSSFLYGSLIILIFSLVETTIGQEKRVIRYFLRAASFIVAGFFASSMVSVMHGIGYDGLDIALLVAGVLAGLVSFTGLWEGDVNSYTSYIGEKWGNNLRSSVVVIFVASVYGIALRSRFIVNLGTSAGFMYLMEWGIVTGVGYFMYQGLMKSVSTTTIQRGKWTEHVQTLERKSEKDLDKWSIIIDNFIKEGDQTLLVVYLIELLRRNNVSLDRIRIELYDLMRLRDKEAPIGLVFSEEARRVKLEEHRRVAVNTVIDRIQERIG